MSSLFDSLSDELFQVLKGSGKTLTLYGSDGNKTYDPKKARRVFAVPGNLMISVVEAGSDSEVKLYLSQSTDVEEIAPLIQTLRQITTRFNVLFNVRKFGRELAPKDFAYQVTVTEAAMWGTNKTSYQKFGPSKLIVRHTMPVREGVIGARGRNILSMFVETIEGERFKFPANHLSGGRAFAQHINQGGKPHDKIGTQIAELALESIQLANTARYIHHNRNVLGEAATAIRPTIKNRVMEVRRAFSALARPRGYTRISEAGLPMMNSNLFENADSEVSRLAGILQIDANHLLAEALKPVALLTLGENMTNRNNLFNGVIALEDAAADALIEALADEYGYDASALSRNQGLVTFNEEAAFEDAQSYLDMVQESYMINEENAIVAAARKWYQDRFDSSDYEQTGGIDKDVAKGEQELIDGITAIASGHIEMPDFPMRAPQFSKAADAHSKSRFYLDLYVTQHKLANAATLNFVSGIIDKMAEGKKLAPIETFIANTLIKALDDDLNLGEGVVDEAFDDWDASQGSRNDTDFNLDYVVDDLTPEDVLNYGGHEHVVQGENPQEFDAVSRKELVDSTVKLMFSHLEAQGSDDLPYNDSFLRGTAEEYVDQQVIPYVQQKGFELTEGELNEFAAFDEKPEHHGVAAGDNVSTDLGSARVISVEGDLAVIEFLSGETRTLHVDDMDVVPGLSNVAEEAQLSDWFESFEPSQILGELSSGKMQSYFSRAATDRARAEREADKTGDTSRLDRRDRGIKRVWGKMREGDIDEAREPVYHSVFAQNSDGSWSHQFDADDAEDAKDEVRSLRNIGDKGIIIKVPKSQADWTSTDPNQFVQQHLANKQKPQMAAEEIVDEARKNVTTATTYIEYNGEEDVEIEIEYNIHDGSFATGLDHMPNYSYGPEIDIDGIVIKSTGEDISGYVDADRALMDQVQQACIDDAQERHEIEVGQQADYARDDFRESDEEILGGDQGEDLIRDTKVDEAFQAELDALLKNARFRM